MANIQYQKVNTTPFSSPSLDRTSQALNPLGYAPGKFGEIGQYIGMPHLLLGLGGGKTPQMPQLVPDSTGWQTNYGFKFDQQTDYDIARQQALGNSYMNTLNKYLQGGEKFANNLYKPGVLGSLDTQPLQDVANQARMGLGGFTAPENQAMMDQANRQSMQGYNTATRNLKAQQAASGVRGASATAQHEKAGRDFMKSQIEAKQNLAVQNVQQKQTALQSYAAANQNLAGIQQFNLGQREKEFQGRLSAQLGYAGLGQAAQSSAQNYFANRDALSVQNKLAGYEQQLAASKGGKK